MVVSQHLSLGYYNKTCLLYTCYMKVNKVILRQLQLSVACANFTNSFCLFLAGNLSIILENNFYNLCLRTANVDLKRVCLPLFDSEKGAGSSRIPSEKHQPLCCCEVTVGQFSDKIFHMNLMETVVTDDFE